MNEINDTAGFDPIEGRSLSDYLEILRRRRKPALLTFALILLAAISLAIYLPSTYRSSAVIMIEQQEIPQDLVRSTITSFADQRIQVLSQRVMTSQNLWEVIRKFDLYPDLRNKAAPEQVIARFREDTRFETISADVIDPRSGRPTEATIAFSLSFDSSSPEVSQKIANELTSLYLQENIRNRNRSVADTTQFLQKESGKLEAEIAQLESRIAEFKEKNQGALPTQSEFNMRMLDRLETDISNVDAELRAASEREIFLSNELAQTRKNMSTVYGRSDPLLDPGLRAQALQSEYTSALARYSADHPDVVRLRNELAAMGINSVGGGESLAMQIAAARTQLQSLHDRYSPEHPDVIAQQRKLDGLLSAQSSSDSSVPPTSLADVNPAYTQLRSQLDAVRLDKQTLRKRAEDYRSKLFDLERNMTRSPEVESTLATMTREYDIAVARYQEIKAKQVEANLAESLETGNKGERFTLLEPPTAPEIPVKPNRPALLMLGGLLACGAALALTMILEALDSSITSRHALVALTGVAPLGVIPNLLTESGEKARRRRTVLATLVLVAILIGLAFAVVHVTVKPLNELFTQSMVTVGV